MEDGSTVVGSTVEAQKSSWVSMLEDDMTLIPLAPERVVAIELKLVGPTVESSSQMERGIVVIQPETCPAFCFNLGMEALEKISSEILAHLGDMQFVEGECALTPAEQIMALGQQKVNVSPTPRMDTEVFLEESAATDFELSLSSEAVFLHVTLKPGMKRLFELNAAQAGYIAHLLDVLSKGRS